MSSSESHAARRILRKRKNEGVHTEVAKETTEAKGGCKDEETNVTNNRSIQRGTKIFQGTKGDWQSLDFRSAQKDAKMATGRSGKTLGKNSTDTTEDMDFDMEMKMVQGNRENPIGKKQNTDLGRENIVSLVKKNLRWPKRNHTGRGLRK